MYAGRFRACMCVYTPLAIRRYIRYEPEVTFPSRLVGLGERRTWEPAWGGVFPVCLPVGPFFHSFRIPVASCFFVFLPGVRERAGVSIRWDADLRVPVRVGVAQAREQLQTGLLFRSVDVSCSYSA